MVSAHDRVFIINPDSWIEPDETNTKQEDKHQDNLREMMRFSPGFNPVFITKVDFCIEKYREAYGNSPNAVIASDFAIKKMRNSEIIVSWKGNPKGAYTGLGLRTSRNPIKVYKGEGIVKTPEDVKRLILYPLTFATQSFWDRTRELLKAERSESERFYNQLWCDISMPESRLEEEIRKQIRK